MKQALCVNTADVKNALSFIGSPDVITSIDLEDINDFNIDALTSKIVDRAECETNTETLQVIPYVTLLAEIDDVPSIYVYSRGQVGDQRLSGKCSIGFGGHIEQVDVDSAQKIFSELNIPDDMQAPTPSLLDYITTCAMRELREEIGLELSHVAVNLRAAFSRGCLLYNNTDEVGQVHLGLSIAITMGSNPKLEIDGVEVTKGEWVPISTVFSDSEFDFETWTKLVIVRVAKNINDEAENAIGFYKLKLEESIQYHKDNCVDIASLEKLLNLTKDNSVEN